MKLFGIDAPICQDGRSGGFTELLARAEVSHDALIDFPSEKACKASDDVPFRPSIRPASDDIVDRRLVIAHTDHDGSMEGASVIKCWRSELKLQLSRYLQPILTLTHL